MEQQYPQDVSSLPPAPPPPRRRSGVLSVLCALILVLSVAVILNETLLQIQDVEVKGISIISKAEAKQSAGLDKAVGYFNVNEKKIAEGINSNHYLIYERMEKQFPNSLTIYVKERVPVARAQQMGTNYYLDDQGMVLEKSYLRLNSGSPDDMVVVTGLKPKELRVGSTLAAGTANHMKAYLELFQELELQDYLSQISELNITDPESIYLVTRDG